MASRPSAAKPFANALRLGRAALEEQPPSLSDGVLGKLGEPAPPATATEPAAPAIASAPPLPALTG